MYIVESSWYKSWTKKINATINTTLLGGGLIKINCYTLANNIWYEHNLEHTIVYRIIESQAKQLNS